MFKRNPIHPPLVSALALATLCLLSTVATAQKAPQSDQSTIIKSKSNISNNRTSGAPIEGAVVRVNYYGGLQVGGDSMRSHTTITTKKDGSFTFPVVPRGEYTLTMSLPEDAQKHLAGVKYCDITLKLPGGGTDEIVYDLAQNKAYAREAFLSTAQSNLRPESFIVHSDGRHPLNGVVRSNSPNDGTTTP